MKNRETKARDLAVLTESLATSKSAMVISFSGLTVQKDQEFRNSLRAAGAKYKVVKNTLARIAVKGTPFEEISEHFKGVTAIAWTDNDPVVLSKAVSKFMKENADFYTFKTGVVEGKVVDLKELTEIAKLPSKEELISKLLFLLSAPAQRLVTVIHAVPRNLAVVIKQIGESKPADATANPVTQVSAEETVPAEKTSQTEQTASTEEASPVEDTTPVEETSGTAEEPAEAPASEGAEAVQVPAEKQAE